MKHVSKFLIFIFCVLLSSQQARSEEDILAGRWKQVSSNAGKCATCTIGITKHGQVLTISANNGWSATAETGYNGPANKASGKGHWKIKSGSHYGNKAFDILLAVRRGKLTVIMVVEAINGRTQTIEAVFTKIAPDFPLRKA